MNPKLLVLALGLVWACLSVAQKQPPSTVAVSAAAKPAPAAKLSSTASSASQDELKQVLAQMSQAAAKFKCAQADFEFDNYTTAFQEHDIQKGQIYFRRSGKENEEVAINVVSPIVKIVLYKEGKLSLYMPGIDQVTVKEVGKNKLDVETILNLGFGARGDELLKSFDVTMDGWETIDGVKTAKILLIGKSDTVKKLFKSAILWIDPERDVPLQQQVFDNSGDYRLNHYTGIKLTDKLPNDVFRLKTTSKTQFVSPQ